MSPVSGRTLGVLAIASVVYYVLAVAAVHLLQPELDPLTVPMSAYVLGEYGTLMTTTFFVLCVGLLAVGCGLLQALPRTRVIKVAFALTLIASAGILIAGLFPTDWPPPFRSTSSQVHQMAALVAFPAMTIAPGLFSLNFRRSEYWERISVAALALSAGIVAAEAFLLATSAVAFLGVGGVVQRLFLALLLIWMLLVGRHLTRAARGARAT